MLPTILPGNIVGPTIIPKKVLTLRASVAFQGCTGCRQAAYIRRPSLVYTKRVLVVVFLVPSVEDRVADAPGIYEDRLSYSRGHQTAIPGVYARYSFRIGFVLLKTTVQNH